MRLFQLIVLALGVSLAAFCQQGNPAKLGADAPTLGYKEVSDWPAEPLNAAGTPAGPWNFIQVSGIAVDSQGHILVLHRGAYPILEFESSGKLVRGWGDGMFSEGRVGPIANGDRVPGKALYSAVYGPPGCVSCGAHAIRVDPDRNVWVIDAPGHVIFKMNPQGKTVMTLGHRGVAGAGHDTFNLPTDVAFAPSGEFYVSDGYAGNRVVKFSHDGKYLLEWGSRGTGPGEFELPHNIAVDAEGRVYVADRETKRIEVFDSTGHFLNQFPTIDGVSGLFLTKDQQIWAGGVLLSLKGEVLGKVPGGSGSSGHAVAVSDSGDVYLALLNGRVQKFSKQ